MFTHKSVGMSIHMPTKVFNNKKLSVSIHMSIRRCTTTAASGLMLYIGSISASPTACLSGGYESAGTKNDFLTEAVILSTGPSIPPQ